MCIYRYCYYSACRHGELTRISYCDKTAALDLPLLDRRSQEKADAGSSSRDQHATSSLHPSAPKVNISTSSHPNTQQQQQSQNKVIMSTLTPSEAGRSPALHINAQNEQEQTHRRAALIPQSALDEEERARLEATLSHARSLLDSQGFNNVYINIPLSIQSELQMKTTHDGLSGAPPRISSRSVESSISHTMSPGQEQVLENIDHESVTRPIEQPARSPRKSLPSHWLPRPVSPKLATAQRAKDRTYKKQSESGSPAHVKTLRTTHSSVELGKVHGREGGTYLTKEALAAVEPPIAPTKSPSSPGKYPISPPKLAWEGRTSSPQCGVARQQPVSSPTKPSHCTHRWPTEDHMRAISKVVGVTYCMRNIFSEDSPEQLSPNIDNSLASGVKVNGGGKASLSRAKPPISIPTSLPTSHADFDSDHEAVVSPTAEGCSTNTSRIPRVGGTVKNHNASRIPALQRTRSVQTIRSKTKTHGRHNESGETKAEIAEPKSAKAEHSDSNMGQQQDGKAAELNPDVRSVKHAHFPSGKKLAEYSANIEPGLHQDDGEQTGRNAVQSDECSQSSRQVSSSSTIRVSRDFAHPVSQDPAIIYSSKEEVSGSDQLTSTPHNTTSTTGDHVIDSENIEPVRTREKDRVSSSQTQADNTNSTQHRMGSDLRATAAEFVPQFAHTTRATEPVTEAATLDSLQDVAGLPDMTMLDRNSIPFLWYMYGIQFAYEQGVRNGRPKPARKFKPRKPRDSVSSSGGPLHTVSLEHPATEMSTVGRPLPVPGQSRSYAEIAALPISPHGPNSVTGGGDFHANIENLEAVRNVDDGEVFQPFASQYDKIDEQTAVARHKDNNTPRHYNIDLTRAHNVGFPVGPRNHQAPTYYTMPRYDHRNNRFPRNGLYGGRGITAGIPIDATTPFPNPVPPQGRPRYNRTRAGNMTDCTGYAIAQEACGIVDITSATELIGDTVCNTCDPNH